MNTRRSLPMVAGMLLAVTVAACGSDVEGTNGTADEGQTLRVALYGSPWSDSVKKRVGEKFTEETGANVAYTEGNPSDYAPKIIAAGGTNVPFDVVYTDGITQTDLVEQGLLEKLDTQTVKSASLVDFPALNEGYDPGTALWYIGLAYNTEELKKHNIDPPKSWEDLFNPALAGKIALPDVSTAMGLPTVAAAAAVATGDPYNMTAGVEKLAELDLYSIYKSSSQMQTDFANGNIWIAPAADGRAWQLADQNVPVDFVLPTVPGLGQKSWLDRIFVDVVKGTPNQDLAETFQEISHRPEAQIGVAEDTAYSPIVVDAIKDLYAKDPKKWPHRWPAPEEVTSIATVDYTEVVPQVTDVTNEFNQTLGG